MHDNTVGECVCMVLWQGQWTHGLGFLSQHDRIVVMDDSKVTESGAYAELIDGQQWSIC